MAEPQTDLLSNPAAEASAKAESDARAAEVASGLKESPNVYAEPPSDEAALDAALAEVDKRHGMDEAEAALERRLTGEEGPKKADREEAGQSTKEEEEGVAGGGDEKTTPDAKAGTDADLSEAASVLRRMGLDPEDFDSKQVLSLGARLGEQMAKVQGKFDELSQRIEAAGKGGPDEKATAATTGGGEPADTGSGHLGEVVQAYVANLSEELGESVGEKAKAVFAAYQQAYMADYSQQREAIGYLVEQNIRHGLGEKFPVLREDDSAWEKTASEAVERFAVGVKNGRYDESIPGMREAFVRAAEALHGSQAKRPAPDSKTRDAAQPTPPTRRSRIKSGEKLSRDRYESMLIDAIESNDQSSLADVQQAWGEQTKSTPFF